MFPNLISFNPNKGNIMKTLIMINAMLTVFAVAALIEASERSFELKPIKRQVTQKVNGEVLVWDGSAWVIVQK